MGHGTKTTQTENGILDQRDGGTQMVTGTQQTKTSGLMVQNTTLTLRVIGNK
jgi:hypothetical protein